MTKPWEREQRQQQANAYADLRSNFGFQNWQQPLRLPAHKIFIRQQLGIPRPDDANARMRGVVYGLQPGEERPCVINMAKRFH